MIQPRAVTLFHDQWKQHVSGRIVTLTAAMANAGIRDAWWAHLDLKERFDPPPPIDRRWDWNEMGIEFGGQALRSEKVALIAGPGDPVQGR